MGFFSGIEATIAVQRIMEGSIEFLSMAQVTMLNVNMPDAQKNLSPELYAQVRMLYRQLQKLKNKIPVDAEAYFEMAVAIIRQFDAIAPYEHYSGSPKEDTAQLLEQIRNDKLNR